MILEDVIIKRYLKPRVLSDLPGRLRVEFRQYKRLPEQAKPYLHYVQEVLEMLHGVTEVVLNVQIGTILVYYDAKQTSSGTILHWMDIVVDTCLELSKELNWGEMSEEEIERVVRSRLTLRLPKE